MIRAVIFDLGHTIMDELWYRHIPLRSRPVRLMPGVLQTLPRIPLSKGIWANTKRATESGIRAWLRRANIDRHFKWVVTSVDAGYRKPDPRFFDFALNRSGLHKQEVLFVGNQLNTDIKGAALSGIQSVWLSGASYRSPDDTLDTGGVRPTYAIPRLHDLPALVERLNTR
jgi:putative hydrolase of the HAD superfamily